VCQENETSSSARIRDNQRRSRNRRKELIDDLQKRVQTYEQNGVTATQDMQRAARKVAQENLRLRSLLAHHGISQEAVDFYLRSFDTTQVSSDTSPMPARTPLSYHNVALKTVPVHGLGAAEFSCHTGIADQHHVTSHNFGTQLLEENQTQNGMNLQELSIINTTSRTISDQMIQDVSVLQNASVRPQSNRQLGLRHPAWRSRVRRRRILSLRCAGTETLSQCASHLAAQVAKSAVLETRLLCRLWTKGDWGTGQDTRWPCYSTGRFRCPGGLAMRRQCMQ
jgi:hypothetical protein